MMTLFVPLTQASYPHGPSKWSDRPDGDHLLYVQSASEQDDGTHKATQIRTQGVQKMTTVLVIYL